MARKKIRRSRVLVLGYLERVSSKLFSDFPQVLTGLVGKQHGVYALYKGRSLYYVGLATNLKSRVNQHLKDKHAGKWDKFSVYLVRKADHIKELETLIMRVATPTGNTARGRLPRATNVLSSLRREIQNEHRRQIDALLGIRRSKRPELTRMKRVRSANPKKTQKNGDLASITKKPLLIRGSHKGTQYSAVILKSGSVRFGGQRYASLTAAAKAASKRKSVSGWYFWKFRNADGDWVKLCELKKK